MPSESWVSKYKHDAYAWTLIIGVFGTFLADVKDISLIRSSAEDSAQEIVLHKSSHVRERTPERLAVLEYQILQMIKTNKALLKNSKTHTKLLRDISQK